MAEMKVDGSFRSPGRNSPTRGEILPGLALPSADGREVRLSDYRGRSNLVLILAGRMDDARVLQVLDEAARRYPELAGEEAEVVVVLLKDREAETALKRKRDWPFVILTDRDGHAHRWFNALEADGRAIPAIFIADRYGEIYAEYRAEEWQGRSMPDEILQWLFFINSQCPECGVPEWPQ